MTNGVDSVTAPTAGQAHAAAAAGTSWWAGYVGGSSAAGVWAPEGWHALSRAGIKALPIWVPDQTFSQDPVRQAQLAMQACERVGLRGVVALDTEHSATGNPDLRRFVDLWNRTLARAGWTSVVYDGAGYHGSAFAWHPSWDGNPATGPHAAKQYAGSTSRWGVNVDLDSAGRRFPFSGGAAVGAAHPVRVVLSAPELTSLADLLKDSQDRVVSVERQAMSLLASLQEPPGGTAGAGRTEIDQAVAILERVTGPGAEGLRHLRGAFFQDEAFVRRARDQALRADRREGTLTASGMAGVAAGWRVLRQSGGVPAELARYGNGRVPLNRLTAVGSGQHLWAPAAVSFLRMRSAARAAGVRLEPAASYRSYATQVALKRTEPALAAVPGTSDHGWGRAVDVDGARAQRWLDANARRFGWYHQVPGEPWHFTFGPEHIV